MMRASLHFFAPISSPETIGSLCPDGYKNALCVGAYADLQAFLRFGRGY